MGTDMAPTIERECGIGPLRFLAKTVTSNKSKTLVGKSLYVNCPELKEFNFHTYSTGDDLHKPDYPKPVNEYGKGEYVWLVYEESKFTDGKYTLTTVENADISLPDVETIGGTELPKTCPVCGEKTAAVCTASAIGGKEFSQVAVSPETDYCEIPDDRRKWFDIPEDRVYVH